MTHSTLLPVGMLLVTIVLLIAGARIGSRVPTKTSQTLIICFGIPGFLSFILVSLFSNILALLLLPFFPLTVGLVVGSIKGAQREAALWQAQLTKDEASKASPLIIAHDHEQIGDALNKVRYPISALAAYDRAYAIYEKQDKSDPSRARFYRNYARLLRELRRYEDPKS